MQFTWFCFQILAFPSWFMTRLGCFSSIQIHPTSDNQECLYKELNHYALSEVTDQLDEKWFMQKGGARSVTHLHQPTLVVREWLGKILFVRRLSSFCKNVLITWIELVKKKTGYGCFHFLRYYTIYTYYLLHQWSDFYRNYKIWYNVCS